MRSQFVRPGLNPPPPPGETIQTLLRLLLHDEEEKETKTAGFFAQSCGFVYSGLRFTASGFGVGVWGNLGTWL